MERLTKRVLPIPLTEKELVTLGENIASISSTLAATRVAKKSSEEAYKNKIAGLEDDFSEIMTKIRTKTDHREVECLEVKDFQKKVINYVYNDMVLETVPLTEAERQITMF